MFDQYGEPDIYEFVSDVHMVRHIFAPLLDLPTIPLKSITSTSQKAALRKSKYKNRIYVQFEVDQLKNLRIPTSTSFEFINSCFLVFLLYQSHTVATRFELYLVLQQHCRSHALYRAVCDFIQKLGLSPRNIKSIGQLCIIGNAKHEKIRFQMQHNSGYFLGHYFIDYFPIPATMQKVSGNAISEYSSDFGKSTDKVSHSNSITSSKKGQHENQQGVILTDNGKIFNVREFAHGCICVMENLIFFSKNEAVRALQQMTDLRAQQHMLRIIDHRPIVQRLWMDTVEFALKHAQQETLLQRFTQEQIATLFNCNKAQINTTFNCYALGGKSSSLVQPHPVRALLDHISYLQACGAFDFSYYSIRQCTMNWIMISYYLAKDFLTDDFSMSNSRGAIGLIGRPGSGKSRISWILHSFFNGFLFQDSEKGISEFWNQDIASKSFIHTEEVNLSRLCTSDWKVLADLEASIKCRVKNKEDIEATKYVPVVMTSNGDVYQQVILQAAENESMDAAHRRWIFIRFFSKWCDAHPELVDAGGNICSEFRDIYASKTTDYELMNSLIGCALMFYMHNFVDMDYLHGYYYHCLLKFTETIFGQVALANFTFIHEQVAYFTQLYSSCADAVCQQGQFTFQQKFEVLIIDYMNSILPEETFAHQRAIIANANISLHHRCLQIGITGSVKKRLVEEAPILLEKFLAYSSKKHSLYKNLWLMMTEKKLSTSEMMTAEAYFGQEGEDEAEENHVMAMNESYTSHRHNDEESILVSEEGGGEGSLGDVAQYLKPVIDRIRMAGEHFQFESSVLEKDQNSNDTAFRAFSLC